MPSLPSLPSLLSSHYIPAYWVVLRPSHQFRVALQFSLRRVSIPPHVVLYHTCLYLPHHALLSRCSTLRFRTTPFHQTLPYRILYSKSVTSQQRKHSLRYPSKQYPGLVLLISLYPERIQHPVLPYRSLHACTSLPPPQPPADYSNLYLISLLLLSLEVIATSRHPATTPWACTPTLGPILLPHAFPPTLGPALPPCIPIFQPALPSSDLPPTLGPALYPPAYHPIVGPALSHEPSTNANT